MRGLSWVRLHPMFIRMAIDWEVIMSVQTIDQAGKYWNPGTAALTESRHTYQKKIDSGFFSKYMNGDVVLDVGYKGSRPDAVPVLKTAIGVDLDYPGYNGIRLPFADASVDAVYSSHCLEHIANYTGAYLDWFRVLRVGGYVIVVVPHMYLYERKSHPPSRWNQDHKRFYTPARLLREVEETLPLDQYRVCHLCENWNERYDYRDKLDAHASGPYEIEMVLTKIQG
ncbi:hypothetical protein AO057_15710 [Curvibacter sp. PAE-UM]|nr:hypothetical protein AO057_15710 [Curvibacter sp. PAE-UM]